MVNNEPAIKALIELGRTGGQDVMYGVVTTRAVKGGDADGGVVEADHQENSALLEQCHRPSDQGGDQSHNIHII